jgi:trk system potassium uptake protein TrkA
MSLRKRIAALFRRDRTPSSLRATKRVSHETEFAVIGLGVFGRSLALRLSELGFTVLGIDASSEVVQVLADDLSASLVADATNEEALRQADIEAYSTAIVSIGGSHFEAAALTTITLAKLGVPRIIAVADSGRQAEILEAIGATRVLNPVEQSAIALADELVDPGRGDTWSITADQQAALVQVPADLAQKPVAECERHGVTVLLVARGDAVNPHPDPAFVLQTDDVLLVHGTPVQVLNFRNLA